MADLADSIAKLLRDRRPFAYCDVCWAAELNRHHDEIRERRSCSSSGTPISRGSTDSVIDAV